MSIEENISSVLFGRPCTITFDMADGRNVTITGTVSKIETIKQRMCLEAGVPAVLQASVIVSSMTVCEIEIPVGLPEMSTERKILLRKKGGVAE